MEFSGAKTDNTEYLALQLFVPTELVLVLKIIQLATVTPGINEKSLFLQFL